MTKEREALKLALEALEKYQTKRQDFDRFADEIIAIKEALEQPEQKCAQESAVRTLDQLGYTYHGSTHWKPPLGTRPAWLDATLADEDTMQEPVANITVEKGRFAIALQILPDGIYDLYTTPPKRQPLTLKQQQEIEIDMTINQGFAGMNIGYLIGLVIKATEAAHDIKETT